jgi:hypothetical protein
MGRHIVTQTNRPIVRKSKIVLTQALLGWNDPEHCGCVTTETVHIESREKMAVPEWRQTFSPDCHSAQFSLDTFRSCCSFPTVIPHSFHCTHFDLVVVSILDAARQEAVYSRGTLLLLREAQLLLNVVHQINGILFLGKQLDCDSARIDQVLEKVVLNVSIGNVLLQLSIDWIVVQRRNTQDGKVDGESFFQKALNFRIRRELLMEIRNGKGQDGKFSISELCLQLDELSKVR